MYFFWCVCVCLCVHVCVSVFMCAVCFTCMEARGQSCSLCHLPCSRFLSDLELIFLAYAGWLVSPRGSPVSVFPELRLQAHTTMSGF